MPQVWTVCSEWVDGFLEKVPNCNVAALEKKLCLHIPNFVIHKISNLLWLLQREWASLREETFTKKSALQLALDK